VIFEPGKKGIYFSTYPPTALIHLSHRFTSSSKRAGYKCFYCCLSNFRTSASTSSSSAKLLPSSCEPHYAAWPTFRGWRERTAHLSKVGKLVAEYTASHKDSSYCPIYVLHVIRYCYSWYKYHVFTCRLTFGFYSIAAASCKLLSWKQYYRHLIQDSEILYGPMFLKSM
jgi:hypothetical protein